MTTGYIIDAARTPRGRGKPGKGALSGIHPQELFAQVLNTLRQRAGFDPGDVDDVVMGCVSQVGEQGANVARNAVLAAGWPIEVSATSGNRFCGPGLQALTFAARHTEVGAPILTRCCGAGLQAITFAAMAPASGALGLAVAGGVESMSR